MTEIALNYEKALEAIEAVQQQSRFARLMLALAVLGGALSLVLLVVLLNREQMHTKNERAKDDLLAVKSRQLRSALDQVEKLQGASAELTIAIKKAAQIDNALGDDAVVPSDLRSQKPQPAPSSVPASPDQATSVTVATGLPSGWDIDVFWCSGAAATSDYALARAAATALASAATSQQEIAPGVRLGVVRLRPVPDAKFAAWIRGTRVIADPGIGDVSTANAVIAYLAKASAGIFSLKMSVGSPTRYYVSVSACNSR